MAIYSEVTGASPLTTVEFDEIADVELFRNESFFEDSEITIQLRNGQSISFPVSSEYDKDQDFFDAIRERSPQIDNADLQIDEPPAQDAE